jgi:hypothetical protein
LLLQTLPPHDKLESPSSNPPSSTQPEVHPSVHSKPLSIHCPMGLQVWGWLPLHWKVPGLQLPVQTLL